MLSSLTVLEGDKYTDRRNVYFCLLPLAWWTIAFEAGSYIVPSICTIIITTYAAHVSKEKQPTNENINSDMSTSTDNRPTQFSPDLSITIGFIARIAVPLSSLCICASVMRLIGVVFNYDPLILVISLICDTVAYTIQPLAFVCSSTVLKNNFAEFVTIRFSRTTTSVQVPTPSHTLNIVPPSIPSVNDSLAISKGTTTDSATHIKALQMDEGAYNSLQVPLAAETARSWKKFAIPKNTDIQNKYEFSLGACGGDSPIVQFGSTFGLYEYVSAYDPSSVNVEIKDIDTDLSTITDASPVPQHAVNERLHIAYPYRQRNCSTSRKYSRTSFETVHEDKQVMHMHGSLMHESEQVLPTVQVDSIGVASSKQYRISTACGGGLLRETDTKSQRISAHSWLESQDYFTRKESDTGELVVRKY